jgi:hypothetical protein
LLFAQLAGGLKFSGFPRTGTLGIAIKINLMPRGDTKGVGADNKGNIFKISVYN